MGVYWGAQAAAAYLLFPMFFDGWGGMAAWREPGYAVTVAMVLGAIMLMQASLVMPVRPPQQPDAPRTGGFEVWVGGAALGAMAAYLCAVVVACLGIFEALGFGDGWWLLAVFAAAFIVGGGLGVAALTRLSSANGVPVRVSIAVLALASAHLTVAALFGLAGVVELAVNEPFGSAELLVLAGVILLLNWLVGAVAMWTFTRSRDPESALRCLVSRLFLGTLIETAALIPIDVMIRRKTSCYCEETTLWALTFCWGVGTLTLGPAIWLVPLSKRRRRWHGGRCEVCDYDMSGCMKSLRCPECGAGWRTSGALAEPQQDGPTLRGAEAEGVEAGPRDD
jgi:hypothetical protein